MSTPSRHPAPTRRAGRALAAGALVAALGAGATGAGAAPEFIDGAPAVATGLVLPVVGMPQAAPLSSHTAGFLGERNGSAPVAGDVVYLRGAVTRLNGQLPVEVVLALDPALAPDAQLAVSAQTPLRCVLAGAPFPCPVTPGAGPGFSLGQFPLPAGQVLTVEVPFRVTKPKAGAADGAAAQFSVTVLHAGSTAATAVQFLTVAPAPAPPPAPAGGGTPAPAGGGIPAPTTQGAPDRVAPQALNVRTALVPPRFRKVREVRLSLSEAATVEGVLQRRARGRFTKVRDIFPRSLSAGPQALPLGRVRVPGSYRVILRLDDAAGNTSKVTKTFTVF